MATSALLTSALTALLLLSTVASVRAEVLNDAALHAASTFSSKRQRGAGGLRSIGASEEVNTNAACGVIGDGDWCVPASQRPGRCPAHCELEVEYRAVATGGDEGDRPSNPTAETKTRAGGGRFNASFALLNNRPAGTEEVVGWQLSWAFAPGEGIARGADGGWMSAMRGDTAILISPGGAGGQPARVVNTYGAGRVSGAGGVRDFSFTGYRADAAGAPEPVRSVTLNGAPCSALSAPLVAVGDVERADEDRCQTPVRRYCCGEALQSASTPLPVAPPPPPPLKPPVAPSFVAFPANSSGRVDAEDEETAAPPSPLNIPNVALPSGVNSSHADVKNDGVVFDPTSGRVIDRRDDGRGELGFAPKIEYMIWVVVVSVVFGCIIVAGLRFWLRGPRMPSTVEEFGGLAGTSESAITNSPPRVHNPRKHTLLLPGQCPATVSADVEGVVVVQSTSENTHAHSNRRAGMRTATAITQLDVSSSLAVTPQLFTATQPLPSVIAAASELFAPGRGRRGVSEIQLSEISLGHVLGRGAYGAVRYGEWRTRSKAKVAVKMLHTMTGVSNGEARTFIREVNVLSRLSHPSIVRLIGACLEMPHICIVEELMEGGSLYCFIHGSGGDRGELEEGGEHPSDVGDSSRPARRLTCAETLLVAQNVAAAMAYLAVKGVVHRDLKSHNVLLTSRNPVARMFERNDMGQHGGDAVWAKVADFGIAKARGHTIMATTSGGGTTAGGQGGGLAGTPVYMAPELFRGVTGTDLRAGEKCDVYSFGVLLWECVTGLVPWGWMVNHMQVIFAVAVEGRRLPMPRVDECAARDLMRLMTECWCEDAVGRPTFKAAEERVREMRRRFSRL